MKKIILILILLIAGVVLIGVFERINNDDFETARAQVFGRYSRGLTRFFKPITYQSGWPQIINGEAGTPVVIDDINADGNNELIIYSAVDLDGRANAKIYIFNPDGTLLPGWPVTPPDDPVGSQIAVGDVNNDGFKEIAGYSRTKLFLFDHLGHLVNGWPTNPINAFVNASAPVIEDVEGVGGLREVIVATAGLGEIPPKVYVFNGDGSIKSGWPVTLPGESFSSVGVGDVDNDGKKEIVVASILMLVSPIINQIEIRVFAPDGTLESGWPKILPYGNTLPPTSSPVIGNLDQDLQLEIVFASPDGKVYAFNHNGSTVSGGWPFITGGSAVFMSPVALADVDNNGDIEIIFGGWRSDSSSGYGVYVLNHDASIFSGWPKKHIGTVRGSPTAGDIDGDGDIEILVADEASENSRVYAWHHNGRTVKGFPLKGEAGLLTFQKSSPVLNDLDKDGDIEVAAGGDDNKVYVWDLKGRFPSRLEWQNYQHNSERIGRY